MRSFVLAMTLPFMFRTVFGVPRFQIRDSAQPFCSPNLTANVRQAQTCPVAEAIPQSMSAVHRGTPVRAGTPIPATNIARTPSAMVLPVALEEILRRSLTTQLETHTNVNLKLKPPVERWKQFVGIRRLQIVVSSLHIQGSFIQSKFFLLAQYILSPAFFAVQLEDSVNPIKCTQRLNVTLGPKRAGRKER
jgi:hypothetical protein